VNADTYKDLAIFATLSHYNHACDVSSLLSPTRQINVRYVKQFP